MVVCGTIHGPVSDSAVMRGACDSVLKICESAAGKVEDGGGVICWRSLDGAWSNFLFLGEGDVADAVSKQPSDPNLRFLVKIGSFPSPAGGVDSSLLGRPNAAAEVQPFLALFSQL